MTILGGILSGFRQVASLFFEETQVARYIALGESDNGFTIPDPTTQISDRHIQDIDAPGVINDVHPIIFFRTTHIGRPTFSVRLNPTRLIQHTFGTDGPHSWHKIVPPGTLRAEDNELTSAVSGEGRVTFSDVVILYTSNELTVTRRREPVFTQD